MIADPRNPNWEYDARRNPHKECQAEIARLQEDRAKDRAEMARLREENEKLRANIPRYIGAEKGYWYEQGWQAACGACAKNCAVIRRTLNGLATPTEVVLTEDCENGCRALAVRGPEGKE